MDVKAVRRRNLVTALVSVVFFAVVSLLASPGPAGRLPGSGSDRPSSFFPDRFGAGALFAVCEETLPRAGRWRRPLDGLPDPVSGGASSTLVALGPRRALGPVEADRLRDWVAEGGQLVLCSWDGWPIDGGGGRTLLDRFGLQMDGAGGGKTGNVELSGPLVPPGGLALFVDSSWAWAGSFEGGAVAPDGSTVAAVVRHGAGRLVALPGYAAFRNNALSAGDPAVFLVQLAGGWGDGGVLFDEFHHGFGEKAGPAALTVRFLRTPWGWAAGQLMVAGVLFALVSRRRLGRPEDPPPPDPRGAVQLVDARAGLLRRAGAETLAVDLIHHHLAADLNSGRPPVADAMAAVRSARERGGSGALAAAIDHYLAAGLAGGRTGAPARLQALARAAGECSRIFHHERRTERRP